MNNWVKNDKEELTKVLNVVNQSTWLVFRKCVCVCARVCVSVCVVFFGRLEILGMLQTFIVSTTSLNKIERGKKFPLPFLKGILNYLLNIFSVTTL